VNRAPMTTLGLVNGVLAIVLLVGLPIAFIVARYSR
jgi:ABC-type Fe3+ transport system permease subunit